MPLEMWATDRLKPYGHNPRTHSKAQIQQIARSIGEFGFTNPILAARDGTIIAGHGRLLAAKVAGLSEVPVIVLGHLTETQRWALVIADNQLALNAGWDDELLASELAALRDDDFDLSLVGFSDEELADLLGADNDDGKDESADDLEPPAEPVTRPGDLYVMGEHRLLCGDATDAAQVERLMNGARASLVFTDPPYAIYGSSTGIAADITDDKMVRPFFREVVRACVAVLEPFGHAYVCCDWRSWASWWEVAKGTGFSPKNMIVWDKGGAGLGSNYANTHELVMFGSVVPLRDAMRSQRVTGMRSVFDSNVWRINRAGQEETGEKREHNAQKPVALVTRAIENSSASGDVVVDFFGGSGTTLVACEKTGRAARLLEIDPRYCDLIVRRWQTCSGKTAVLESAGDKACR